MFLMFLIFYGENLCIFVMCFLREGRTQTVLAAGHADKRNGAAYDLDRL